MRIIVLQDYLRCGGTEVQSIFLSTFFQLSGHDVHLLTFRPGGPLMTRLNGGEFEHTALQPFDTHIDFFAPRLRRKISEWRPDVVLCMGHTANQFAGRLQHNLSNVSVIGSVRSGQRVPLGMLRSLKRADAVIVNAEWWRLRLIEHGFDGERIAVVHNALTREWDVIDRQALRSSARNRLGAGPSTVVLMNVAGFRRGKRHELLLDLASRLGTEVDWQLWLVGEGRRWQACQRYARGLNTRDRIKFIGYCDDPFEYYAGADIAVSTSVRDSLPNFLVEAQHMGLPAVATDFRGVGEIVLDGETGFLVPPDDHELFVQRLRELSGQPELRLTIGQRAKERAEKFFSRDTQGRAFLDALSGFRH